MLGEFGNFRMGGLWFVWGLEFRGNLIFFWVARGRKQNLG